MAVQLLVFPTQNDGVLCGERVVGHIIKELEHLYNS